MVDAATGFFWLVGQGGTGIQTSAAAGAVAVMLITGEQANYGLPLAAVNPLDYSPIRLRRH